MKAIIRSKYGGPEVLSLSEVEKPSLKKGHLLVKVLANSANAADWHILRGKPFFARLTLGLFKPKNKIIGGDFAGIVEAVAKDVAEFKPGDRVFGETLLGGTFSEFLCAPAGVCALMPTEIGFPQMASVPIAGLTALQALTTHGKLKADEAVLINGSSGGVGHFTVQIAKAYGAKVTAVCSSKSRDFVKGLGADVVIAYDQEDIHSHPGTYDLLIDTHGNLSYRDFKRMGKRGVLVGFTTLGNMISVKLKSSLNRYPLTEFTAQANTKDLEILASLIEEGKVKAHIERTYPHHKIPEAIAYIEAMRTRGKVAIVWENIL